MMQFKRLEHRFCTHIPVSLEQGVLYVSMEYATAAHRCCCGCGEEVVTPFTPTDWKMIFDGVAISLWPSVGNWTLPCRSHYVVKEGVAIKTRPWSDEEITEERRRDRAAKARYYGKLVSGEFDNEKPGILQDGLVSKSWCQWFWNWVSNRARTR